MPTPSTYNLLLNIPVFQGMGKFELQDIIAHTKLGFEKYGAKKRIQKVGQTCDRLLFLMSGQIAVTSWATDHSYSVTEDITVPRPTSTAPYAIEPERLFGLDNKCTQSAISLTTCNVMALNKSEVVKLIDKYDVFRINLFNLISTRAQNAAHSMWEPETLDFRHKFARFIRMRCTTPYGGKHLNIKRKQLTTELNIGLQNMTKALYALQNEGLIHIRRAGYDIPEIENL